MKKPIIILFIMMLSFGMQAQTNYEQARSETSTFLKSLATMANRENYKMFGLSSPEEATQLETGQAFASYLVPLDRLRKYEGGDITPLITNVNRVSCTVINRQTGQIAGIVELELEKERYQAKGFSSSAVSSALGRINQEFLKQKFSLVRVPALNVYFGSFTDSDGQQKFVSLQNSSSLKTEIGEVRPASEFLRRLVPMANAYNGLPW